MADQSMLGALASYAEGKVRDVSDWWNDLRTFTEKADNEAETRFPGQARDLTHSAPFSRGLLPQCICRRSRYQPCAEQSSQSAHRRAP